MIKLLTILFLCLSIHIELRAQTVGRASDPPLPTVPNGFIIREACKGYRVVVQQTDVSLEKKHIPGQSVDGLMPKRTPLLVVSGNILYDVSYRSRLDTPYAENEIYQHTLQTRLNFVYKGQYPFRLYLTTHFSNSPLFRKYTDMNLGYNQADFARMIKSRLAGAIETYVAARTGRMDSLRRLIDSARVKRMTLDRSLLRTDFSQKLVEERERSLHAANRGTPPPDSSWEEDALNFRSGWHEKYNFPNGGNKGSGNAAKYINKDSAEFARAQAELEKRRRQRDSLDVELQQLGKVYDSLSALRQLALEQGRTSVNEAKDAVALERALHELGVPDTVLPKGYKTLYALESVSLGRSIANYSELSVKDIAINGIQAAYRPHLYYAAAVGKIDYRFRDYIVPNAMSSGQYLVLVRAGIGTKNGNHVFLTYYTGKRQFFTQVAATAPGVTTPEYRLAGVTVEAQLKLNRNLSLIGEVAKSTMPYYSQDSGQNKNWLHDVTRFSNRTNEAYSFKLEGWWPQTQTRFTGMVGRLGANFQSFSTFTTGTAQTRWLGRLEQPFFKRKLTIVSSVQQNAYTSPYATMAYNSSSILASIQATLRIRKWPVVSAGYYPSYQLTKIGGNSYGESRYYTLVGNVSYAYRLHSVMMTSYVLYSRFYNASADSGFVYYNAQNWYVNQQLMVGILTATLGWSANRTTEYALYTLENTEEVALSRWISIGAGVKRIMQTEFNTVLWGYSGNVVLHIPKLGDIQCVLDKGYLPGLHKALMENRVGRLTYLKTF
ncbi:MAG: hypothetical protein J0H74_23625 [Chitinophagaceae bacterium]|nr:hypothetical protein [Chitinophagaceae bacterium]